MNGMSFNLNIAHSSRNTDIEEDDDIALLLCDLILSRQAQCFSRLFFIVVFLLRALQILLSRHNILPVFHLNSGEIFHFGG